MRPAPEPVKLQIANVCVGRIQAARPRPPGTKATIPLKTPQNPQYSRQSNRTGESGKRHSVQLTETGRSRISRANCPRWPGSTGAAHLGRKRSMFGASICGLISFLGELPGQRRTTREADLPTQQTGAQAPSRLSCASRDDRWPQGARRTPRARPQASERLNGPRSEISSWIG